MGPVGQAMAADHFDIYLFIQIIIVTVSDRLTLGNLCTRKRLARGSWLVAPGYVTAIPKRRSYMQGGTRTGGIKLYPNSRFSAVNRAAQ
ncbi:hypothetical protein EDWATA_01755 [Edwardsiella tarda ATCC 23685]|uniref:Uncharacterized protein n=1 Tax=Edwardsiella tarda ATCC 23685 TaxID=500638 RepID=D4F4T2_EDWTA|nr:hypothetical protein CPU03_00770 [Edwardsiella tarda]EFE23230.1 hypothetical protein EDWATA_01755 [Edwardsiella tarda ATCC 23685]